MVVLEPHYIVYRAASMLTPLRDFYGRCAIFPLRTVVAVTTFAWRTVLATSRDAGGRCMLRVRTYSSTTLSPHYAFCLAWPGHAYHPACPAILTTLPATRTLPTTCRYRHLTSTDAAPPYATPPAGAVLRSSAAFFCYAAPCLPVPSLSRLPSLHLPTYHLPLTCLFITYYDSPLPT